MGMQDGAAEERRGCCSTKRKNSTRREPTCLSESRSLSVPLAESRPEPLETEPWRLTLLLVAVEVVVGFLRF